MHTYIHTVHISSRIIRIIILINSYNENTILQISPHFLATHLHTHTSEEVRHTYRSQELDLLVPSLSFSHPTPSVSSSSSREITKSFCCCSLSRHRISFSTFLSPLSHTLSLSALCVGVLEDTMCPVALTVAWERVTADS